MASTWQSIISAVKTRMEGITVVGGYETNLGSNVILNPTKSIEPDEVPALLITDKAPEKFAEELSGGNNVWKFDLPIKLEAIVSNGTNTASDLRKCASDILKAIGVDERWSGLAIETTDYEMSLLDLEQEKQIAGGITITIHIHYRADKYSI